MLFMLEMISFGTQKCLPIVGLLVHLDGHHLVIFLFLEEIRCGGLLVHLVGVGVGELACLLLLFFAPPPFFTLHS